MKNKIIHQVNQYYSKKILDNGTTPEGVDWNSAESQELRFDILSNVIADKDNFSLLDYGCGFGSMYDYFKEKYHQFHFTGLDISEEMIRAAVNRNQDDKNSNWVTALDIKEKFDYVIASGIFNVKLDNSDKEWENYILDTIDKISSHSKKGFSFNILTKYSDKEFMKDYLYYADPLFLFDYCKRNFSRNVALLHDYNLYEFTIIIRKV
ncbi:class I SAM-dependent methyltransferase [uncultured Chryseobacterium sp.]|uniref:class I SAM-dependent methyltransferase n=1 Tax=uncultured Chryseobacterium sp. TaxID=259322 RepID=UPI0025FC9951|nr:class I SAM-dependent methyltransferase [uncultured Chryseobacterium sp.]